MKTWTLSEAQSHFADVVESCSSEPQILATHGRPVAALVDFGLFSEFLHFREARERPTIKELLADLRQIQTQEPVEIEPPDRQDRPNPILEMSDELLM